MADLLRPALGDVAALVTTMAPVAIASFCLLSLGERDPWGRAAAATGLPAVAAVAVMSGFTIWQLAVGPGHPNSGLITVGTVMGTLASAVYAWLACRQLRERPAVGCC